MSGSEENSARLTESCHDDLLKRVEELEQEVQRLRDALDQERCYREFVEKMLGLGISYVATVAVDRDPTLQPSKSLRVVKALDRLKRHRYGRFIQLCPAADFSDLEKEYVSVLRDGPGKESGCGMFELGLCYKFGEGVEQDLAKAAMHFRLASEKECSYADAWWGGALVSGEGVEKNPTEGTKYLKKAADQGNACAQVYYAGCLRFGNGVSRNPQEAERYLKQAAAQNHARAQFLLARDMSDPMSAAYLAKAASQGYPPANLAYAYCLFNGRGVTMDKRRASKHIHYAAVAGYPPGVYQHGMALLHAAQNRAQAAMAVSLIQKAANGGSVKALLAYGLCLQNGVGVQCDSAKACTFLKKAADRGDNDACLAYGICLRNGYGIEPQPDEAITYFKKAADRGMNIARALYDACTGDAAEVERKRIRANVICEMGRFRLQKLITNTSMLAKLHLYL